MKRKKGQAEVTICTAGHVDHGKCLTPDHIVVINRRAVTGYEIIEKARKFGKLLERTEDEEVYKVEGKVLTLNKNLKADEKDFLVYIRKYNGRIIKIRTKSGRILKVTPEHPLLTISGWKFAEKIKEGEKVAVLDNLSIENVVRLKKAEEINEIIVENLSNGYKKIIYGDSYAIIRDPEEFDEDIAYILAFILAEGNIQQEKIIVTQKKKTKMLERFLDIFKEKFGIDDWKKHNHSYHLNNKAFVKYFVEKFELSYGAKRNWIFPGYFPFLPKKVLSKFLSTYIALDGHINKKSSQIEISFNNYNNAIIFSLILLRFGVFPSIYRKVVGGREYWRLTFGIKEFLRGSIKKFPVKDILKKIAEEIFVKVNSKIGKFSKIKKYRTFCSSKEVTKETWLEYKKLFLEKITELKSEVEGNINVTKVCREIGRSKTLYYMGLLNAERVVEEKIALATNLIKYLDVLFNSDVIFDEVVEKKETEYNGEIFDLCVPETKCFIANGVVCHNSTLIKAITGVWTAKYSEELKRGITIKLGYAVTTIWKREDRDPPECYFSANEVPDDVPAVPLRKVSFLDVPGHEMLMTIMISGASVVDGALLVIAANEPCPRPQTKEHLKALEICGVKNIVIIQNKIDTVSKERALKNYEEIKNFVKGTIAEDAPIIPVSAQFGANIDVVLEAIERYIPTPERDLDSPPIFIILRSFDVNLTGKDPEKLVGGVIGGILRQGKLKVGDEIEIRPGFIDEKGNWEPIYTRIESISTGDELIKEAIPGGTVGIATELDPFLTKEDRLVGNVAGKPGKLPDVYKTLELEVTLLERIVGTEKELKMEPLKVNEQVLINAWGAKTLGVVKSIRNNVVEIDLRYPICIKEGERVAISRLVSRGWRLSGYGIVI